MDLKHFNLVIFLFLILTNPFAKGNTDSVNDIPGNINKSEVLSSYISLAKQFFEENNHELAVEYQLKHVYESEQGNDDLQLAKAYHGLAHYYSKWDKYKIAIHYYYKAMALYKQMGNKLWTAHEYNDIGFAYLYWEDYSMVISFYNRALNIYKELDNKKEIALAKANIGFAYCFWGKIDSAEIYHNHALKLYLELKDTTNYSKMYHGLGDVARRKGNYNLALQHFDTAISYGTLNNENIYQHWIRKAQTYTALRDFYNADKCFEIGFKDLKKSQSGKWLRNYYEYRYNYYKAKGDLVNELKAFKQYKAIEDSIFNQRLQSEIVEMQIINETKEKEEQIVVLTANNKLSEQKIKTQKRVLTASIAIIAIITVLLLFIYKQYVSKRDAFRKLFEKNKALIEFENKSKENMQVNLLNDKIGKKTSVQINSTERDRIIEKLKKLIEEEQLFLNPNLNLTILSKKLKTNSAYLSQVINHEFGKNLNNFLNEYRIKTVQNCLLNGEHNSLTIEGIASKCGFKNRATFNTAFKKVTGLTPTYYINSL